MWFHKKSTVQYIQYIVQHKGKLSTAITLLRSTCLRRKQKTQIEKKTWHDLLRMTYLSFFTSYGKIECLDIVSSCFKNHFG